MPRAARLLVIYKKSQLELYREHQPHALEDLERQEPRLYERFARAHDENAEAIESVKSSIAACGMDAEFVYRADHDATAGFDLVIAIGGDGTLLDASHSVRDRPLLGVRSSDMSVGHFCGAVPGNVSEVLTAWEAGEATISPLHRLAVTVNGKPVGVPVLNEVLFAATVPAAMSRYIARLGDREEEHKSSGIWISTAAGSSAAIRSAGGEVMDPADDRLQYVVREPYCWAGCDYQLLSGLAHGPLELLVKMRNASLYMDGHRETWPLTLGDRVSVGMHSSPLRLVAFQR